MIIFIIIIELFSLLLTYQWARADWRKQRLQYLQVQHFLRWCWRKHISVGKKQQKREDVRSVFTFILWHILSAAFWATAFLTGGSSLCSTTETKHSSLLYETLAQKKNKLHTYISDSLGKLAKANGPMVSSLLFSNMMLRMYEGEEIHLKKSEGLKKIVRIYVISVVEDD